MANYLDAFNVTPPSAAPIANALGGIPGQMRENEKLNLLRQRNELSAQKMKADISRASREDQLKGMEWLGQAALAAGDDPIKQKTLIERASNMFGIPVDADDLAAAKMHARGGVLQKQQLAQAGGSVYGTPIYGTDEKGNTVLGVIGKNGQFKRLDTGGVTPTPGVSFQDFGTYRQGFGKGGQPVTPQLPIDVAGKSVEQARGKSKGEAAASLASVQSKLPGLNAVVSELDTLSEQATYTEAGKLINYGRRQLGMEPTTAAVARAQYISTVDNQILPLLRDTFGAQFTEREGQTLRATLGDRDASPKEKQAILKAFIAQKYRDVEALERQTGKRSMDSGARPMGMGDPLDRARSAISRGADPAAVKARLRQMGIDPSGL